MGSSQFLDCSQTQISTILKVQKEGTQIVLSMHPLTQNRTTQNIVIIEEVACGLPTPIV
jgi:hypothetical protein